MARLERQVAPIPQSYNNRSSAPTVATPPAGSFAWNHLLPQLERTLSAPATAASGKRSLMSEPQGLIILDEMPIQLALDLGLHTLVLIQAEYLRAQLYTAVEHENFALFDHFHARAELIARNGNAAQRAMLAAPMGDTSLLKLATFHNFKAHKELLRLGCDPNMADADGNTVLHLAALAGDASLLTLLVRHGGDLTVRGTTQKNVFQLAFEATYLNPQLPEVLTRLLVGALCRAMAATGKARRERQTDDVVQHAGLARRLLEPVNTIVKGKSFALRQIFLNQEWHNMTVLECALHNMPELALSLVQGGVQNNLERLLPDGNSLLHAALAHDNMDLFARLLTYGMSTDVVNAYGETVRSLARNHTRATQLLEAVTHGMALRTAIKRQDWNSMAVEYNWLHDVERDDLQRAIFSAIHAGK